MGSRFLRFRSAAARPTPQRRLRIMYWSMSACALALLIMLRIALVGEHRLATELAAETRAAVAVPHVIVLRVSPSRQANTKTKFNMYHAVPAVSKEK